MIRINDLKFKATLKAAVIVCGLLLCAVVGFGQQTINLSAAPTTVTLPDGSVVPDVGLFLRHGCDWCDRDLRGVESVFGGESNGHAARTGHLVARGDYCSVCLHGDEPDDQPHQQSLVYAHRGYDGEYHSHVDSDCGAGGRRPRQLRSEPPRRVPTTPTRRGASLGLSPTPPTLRRAPRSHTLQTLRSCSASPGTARAVDSARK